MNKTILTPLCRTLATAGLLAACLPAAYAQQESMPAALETSEATPAGKPDKIQEVVVTATRRSTRLQDVPLAVSAMSATQIEKSGVKNLEDMQYVVPGLQVGDSPSDKGFRVRGVGSLTGTYISGQEQPVGVVVDGVVQGLGAGISNLADVERVEVLKGPQGTQFGKNSAAGVINVVTTKPRLKEFSGTLSASYATQGEYETRAGVNAPLGENAAMRVSVYAKGYDDFLQNLALGKKVGGDREHGARVKLLFKPTSDLELLATLDGSKQDLNSGSQLWTVNASPVALAGIHYGLDNMQTREPIVGHHGFDRSGLALEANYQAGDYTLTSVTAHRKLTETDWGGFGQGFDAIPVPGTTWFNDFAWNKSQTTQEFRVTSPKNAGFEYVAGYLYYDQPTALNSTGGIIRNGGWIFNVQRGLTRIVTTTTSHALFADGKLKLSPATAALIGMRYTRDKVHTSFNNADYGGGPLGSAYAYAKDPVPGTPSSTSTQASKLTGKLGIEHRLDTDVLLFGSASTGYLGPIINYGWATGVADVLKPQTNTNLTVGIKSQWLQRRVTVNVNAFRDEYKNFQSGYFTGQPTIQFRGENAASMTSQGLEAELSARIGSSVGLAGAFAYVDAKFGNYCSGGAAAFAAAGSLPACVTTLGTAGGNYLGLQPNSVAKLSGNLSASYDAELSPGYGLATTVSYYFRDKTRSGPAEPLTEVPAYGLVNLNMRLTPESDRWHLSLYARNLLNRQFATAVMSDSFAPPGTYVNWVSRESQRTVGVSVEMNF